MRAVVVDYPPYAPYDAEAAACAEAGWQLEVQSYAELLASPDRADVILNVSADPITPALLERTGCRVAVGYGVGLDWIDPVEAAARGVRVVNMPHANVPDVALHALALILACLRRISTLDQAVRSGSFDASVAGVIRRPSALTLGLLAFGNIPRRLAAYAAPLGFRLAAHDPHVPAGTMETHGVEAVDELDELLRRSDIVSVHLPASPATRGLLDTGRLRLLRRGAIVVVTSRGEVYDAAALAAALHDGHLAAAGVDVFVPEPPPPDHPLLGAPNVLLTPHMAGSSADAVADLHSTAAAVIRAVAAGEEPPGVVPAAV